MKTTILQTTYKAGITTTLIKVGRKYQYTIEYNSGKIESSSVYSGKKVALESYNKFCQGITFGNVPGLIHIGNGMYVTQ